MPAISISSTPPRSSSTCCTFAADRPTAAMRPCPLVIPWAWLRAQITSIDCFRLRAPQAQAAAISPTLCPKDTAGLTPDSFSKVVTATWRANNNGWPTVVSAILDCSGAACSSSINEKPVNGCMARSSWRRRAAKRGDSCNSACPIPTHWAPFPEYTKATQSPPEANPSSWASPGTLAPSAKP